MKTFNDSNRASVIVRSTLRAFFDTRLLCCIDIRSCEDIHELKIYMPDYVTFKQDVHICVELHAQTFEQNKAYKRLFESSRGSTNWADYAVPLSSEWLRHTNLNHRYCVNAGMWLNVI